MELFKDKKQALEELDQLLQEEIEEPDKDLEDEEFDEEEFEDEEFDDEEPEAPAVIYHNYANDYGRRIYNTDRADTDIDDYSDQVYEPQSNSDIKALTAVAIALTAAILGVVIWWLIRFL